VTTQRRTAFGGVVGALVVGTLMASCGFGSTSPTRTTSVAVSSTTLASTSAPDTTVPTTVAATDATTTTVGATVGIAPFTGLPTNDPAVATRPALVVKIDGHSAARPQFGLDQTDIVIEEMVEGISRFMAIFQSQVPTLVGPVRSARTQDVLIVPMLSHPLFAWSGGNKIVSALMDQAPVTNLAAFSTAGRVGQWYRDTTRQIPHNLIAHGAGLFSAAPTGSTAPTPILRYRSAATGPSGLASGGVKVVLEGSHVQWVWNSSTARWVRSENGSAHVAADGVTLSAANVVVLEVAYHTSVADAHSPEAQTVGSGAVLVYTGGHMIQGTWSRPTTSDPWTLTDASGHEIELTPGNTWIELAPIGHVANIPAGVDPNSVADPVR